MLNNKHRMLKNVFIVCFSLFMIVLSIAPAFAEEGVPIKLTQKNILEYPTTTGEMYFDEIINEHITLVGGVVTTDGTAEGEVIPGKWDFIDPNATPMIANTKCPLGIKFIPTDDKAYTGFEIKTTNKTTCIVKEVEMEFVDTSLKPTAELKANKDGSHLGDYNINGIDVKSVRTGKTITTAKWSWNSTSTPVNESGYYPATVKATGYTTIKDIYIYVNVTGDDSEPPISEFPTIINDNITYHEGIKAKELMLKGGKGTVAGHFEIKNPEQELHAGNNSIVVVFIPDAQEQKQITISITAVITAATASFIDEEGNPIVPEIHWTIGNKYSDTVLKDTLQAMRANCGVFKIALVSIPDLGFDIESKYYELSALRTYDGVATLFTQTNTNYTKTLKFKIVIDAQTVTPKISSYGNDEFAVTFDSYTVRPNGTFTVTVDGKDIGVSGVKYNERFTWRPEHSGTYTIKVVYNPIENDTYNINEIEQTLENILTWKINTVNCIAQPCEYGATASVSTPLGDKLGGWKFYDENGKEIQIEYDDTQYSTITFTMPDHEITVKAIDKTQANIPGSNDDSDFFSSFLAWLRNLLARFRALMDAVAQLLQVVG